MENDQWCTVVVPCYNEAERLNLPAFESFLATTTQVRFIFVNDGSQDGTLEMLRSLETTYSDIVCILDLAHNSGKAEAVRNGMLYSLGLNQTVYTGFWDADLATPLSAILKLLEKLQERPELFMIFGSRVRLLGRAIERKAERHYLGRAFATVVSLVLALPIYDSQCGAKLFRANAALGIALEEPFISRWIFDVEIIARYLLLDSKERFNLDTRIFEFPLESWKDVGGSKLRPWDFVKAFGELIAIRHKYLRRGAIS